MTFAINIIVGLCLTNAYGAIYPRCDTITSKDCCSLSSGRAHKGMVAPSSQKKHLRKLCSIQSLLSIKGFYVGFAHYCTYEVTDKNDPKIKNKITLVARSKHIKPDLCPQLHPLGIERLLKGHSLSKDAQIKWYLQKGGGPQKNLGNVFKKHIKVIKHVSYKLCTYYLNGLPTTLIHMDSR